MLRRTSILLGLAILLSLLFPLSRALKESGVDPLALPPTGTDLAGLGVVVAVLPSMALYRHGRLAQRIPRWNLWLALLAVFSMLFLILHVSWSHELLTTYVQEAIGPGGNLPLSVSHLAVMRVAELTSRIGVLVCVVSALVNLHSVPNEDEAASKRRSRR
jgi:hypothetical protein